MALGTHMIRYDLACDAGHAFESWFRDSADFDALSSAGHVDCPHCGSAKVSKAIMAPRISKGTDAASAAAESLAEGREERRARRNAFAYVGKDFAEKALAMHRGDIPDAAIRGEATPAQARQLLEAGVPVFPDSDRGN